MIRPKVFGLGFQKTGTSSLAAILRRLGYRVAGYADFRDLVAREDVSWDTVISRALEVAEQADAAKDTPWPLLYRELDAAFPGSKFIHVIRDTNSWIDSAVGDFADHPNRLHQLIYGVPFPKGHEVVWTDRYERHNREVAAYFADRPKDYLHLRLEDGLSYAAICPFLGEPVLEDPVPHANTRWGKRVKSVFRRFGLQV